MRISDWSSDVCSSDLQLFGGRQHLAGRRAGLAGRGLHPGDVGGDLLGALGGLLGVARDLPRRRLLLLDGAGDGGGDLVDLRSEEHTSELQSLMRISYAVFCLKKKTETTHRNTTNYITQHITHTKKVAK